MSIDQTKIDSFKRRISSAQNDLSQKKATRDLLKKQFEEKVNELKSFGITTIKEADAKIAEYDAEIASLVAQLETDIEKVEGQLAKYE